MATQRFERPPIPPGFDSSRAAQRAADPGGWAYPEAARNAIYHVIADRRDIRRFRSDEVPATVLERILAAAHAAPSVGLMQPWRFIIVRSLETRIAIRSLAQRERMRQADRFDLRARQFLDQKIEGVVEAPLGICVCCDHGDPDAEVLGRGTIPETDVYSAACAIQNLWLAARPKDSGSAGSASTGRRSCASCWSCRHGSRRPLTPAPPPDPAVSARPPGRHHRP